MDYFFVQQEDVSGTTLVIRGDESKHLARVLRKKIGEAVFVTDGHDRMYNAVITEIGKLHTQCSIKAIYTKYNEPTLDLTLAVSPLKNPARFDFLVEKATELGVRHIVPLHCERTIPSVVKQERLEKIALAAVKQSGRSWVPRVMPLTTIPELFHLGPFDLKILLHEKTEKTQNIASVLRRGTLWKTALIVVGPEGGFSDEEVERMEMESYYPASLGQRRLRTETAAMIAVNQILA